MRITWYGHAAFLIETEGTRVILDPYRSPESGGYEPIAERADVVVVSHDNDVYHSHLGQVVPPFEVIRAMELPPGGTTFRSVAIDAVRVFETPEKKVGDEVAIVVLEAEGRKVVFLGDLGHALGEDELMPLRGADVVLAAAGGPPTIDLGELSALLDAIGPKVVVPMHYKTPRINLDILPVERFLAMLDGWPIEQVGGSSFTIPHPMMPGERRIVSLQHAR